MTEQYCPACELVHSTLVEICCNCDGELVERESSDDGEDKTCPICIRVDKTEMA